MKAKRAERVMSAEEVAKETEFSRRRGLYGCTVQHIGGGGLGPFATILSALGHLLGERHEISRRGKVVSVIHILPSLDAYNALMALPVARSSQRPIGIPYARTVYDAGKAFAQCPTCGERILLRARKDFESYSHIEYQQHHEAEHASYGHNADGDL